MAKRIKKIIKPDQRLDWLKRFQGGESPPKIAERDEVDVRTVRKHLKEVIEERENKEAKTMVLRSALESHYADLCGFAERLDARISGLQPVSFNPRDDLFKEALRQHQPRSLIWKNLNRWDSLHQKIAETNSEIKKKLEKVVASDVRLKPIVSASETAVIPGIVAALVFQAEQWAQEFNGLNLDENFISKPTREGFNNLSYGFSQMGEVRNAHNVIIKEVIEDFESRLKQWEEYSDLEKAFTELNRVRKNLHEELSVIILRRVIPGKCKYCPI